MTKLGTKTLALVLVATAATMTAACGSDDAAPAGAAATDAEVLTWWLSGGEADALAALVAVFEQQNPGKKVALPAADVVGVQQSIADRMAADTPPDTFQSLNGVALQKYIPKLTALDDIAAKNGWKEKIPAAVLEGSSSGGSLYAVPVSIERNNLLFYDIKAFKDAKIDPPKTWDDVIAACTTLKAKFPVTAPDAFSAQYPTTGKDFDANPEQTAPIAFGSYGGWTVALLVWDGIFPGVAGAKYRKEFFQGQHSPDDKEVQDTLAKAVELFGCINGDRGQASWLGADKRIYKKKSAMTIMGDWAKGDLTALGMVPKADFGAMGLPGVKENYFIFGAPVFGLPAKAKNPETAKAFLETIGSLDGQTAFNKKKGSVPARSDADPSLFDPMVGDFITDFKSAKLAESWPSIAKSDPSETGYETVLNNAMRDFANGVSEDGKTFKVEPLDVAKLTETLKQLHPKLK